MMKDLEVIGHSWGGFVGQLLGIEHPEIKVHTFEAPGVRELLPREKQALPYSNITNYVMDKNVINDTNTRAGQNFRLIPHPDDATEIANINQAINSLSFYQVPQSLSLQGKKLFKTHSIDTCARAFDENCDFLKPPVEIKV